MHLVLGTCFSTFLGTCLQSSLGTWCQENEDYGEQSEDLFALLVVAVAVALLLIGSAALLLVLQVTYCLVHHLTLLLVGGGAPAGGDQEVGAETPGAHLSSLLVSKTVRHFVSVNSLHSFLELMSWGEAVIVCLPADTGRGG